MQKINAWKAAYCFGSFLGFLIFLPALGFAQATKAREWSDASGNFKITASLLEVKDGIAFLKAVDGKTLKIPLSRLSKPDQDFLKVGANPFEEVGADTPAVDAKPPASPTGVTSPSIETAASKSVLWDGDFKVDWDDVEELDRSSNGDWNFELPKQSQLGFTAKRASLAKKENFHEDIRRMEINPIAQRAVVGFTVSFSVPKPLSRLSLIDLPTGKSIHTATVEADMCPLCLLNDGSTAVMYGTSDERKGFETSDQIELWKVNGKKIVRSKTWIPFPSEAERFGKKSNSHVIDAIPLPNNKLILLGGNGHLACIDATTRKPYWHSKLSQNFAIDASVDRSVLAVMDGSLVMMVDPQQGKVLCSQSLEGKPHLAWTRIKWSPSGTKLLVTFTNDVRVLDLTNGKWIHQFTVIGPPVAPNSISYPHDDFALLENRLLLHIPTQIKVCQYQDATRIACVGGMCFIGMQNADGGFVVSAPIPHPVAEQTLEKARNDPSVFLIHPGVEVAIDASATGEHASKVNSSLQEAAKRAGYRVVGKSPITLVASITGPKQEAVSYIAAGAYIANVYQSSIRMTWQGKDVWATSGNNIPGFIQTGRDQSIQDKLNELGKAPSLFVFENAQFPKLLQRPQADSKGPNQSEALLISKFTFQGLVDSK